MLKQLLHAIKNIDQMKEQNTTFENTYNRRAHNSSLKRTHLLTRKSLNR